ncbi:MAG: hypothetical protein H6625_04620 [Bdellovibrionaceae bacterium]|nr:hypothetical protein [Pseudobdellovibrionaceae bacterium]
MKSKLLIFLGSFFLSTTGSAALFHNTKYPDIQFRYGRTFDNICAAQAKTVIKPEWLTELTTKLPKLQTEWNKNGEDLLLEVYNIFGKSFLRTEMIVTVFTCQKFPSMSQPLLIKISWFLNSSSNNNPQPDHVFVGLTFHELLHTYIYENFSSQWPTGLLKKYKDEPDVVLSHLHQVALQKYIYIKLKRENELKDIIKFDQSLGKNYHRAWEIVNEIEGYKPFIDELKELNELKKYNFFQK